MGRPGCTTARMVVLRPPRRGAGSWCTGIELRLTTRAEHPLRVPQCPPLRQARPARRALTRHRPRRMELRRKRPRKKSPGTGGTKQVPPGEGPLPATADEFVDEIHSRIDLFEVWQGLLRSTDDKIKQRAVERLTDLRYKTGSSQAEEPQQIIFDLPRPKRD
jgi:hypothetical protein